MKQWIQQLERHRFGAGRYSQAYQDELLSLIFANIKTTNADPYCVEFGFNAKELTKGSGANVANFVLHDGWKCLLMDGENENPSINLHRHFLTSNNICEAFRFHRVPAEPEYISIDVDSTDLWLFRSLLTEYRAMVFSVEYNANFPLDRAITFPNEPGESWQKDRGYGASLKALQMVAAEQGYSLLWVVKELDAFFIRNDLIEDGSGMLVAPYEKWKNCTEIPCHGPLKDSRRARKFVDYEVFTHSGGDIEASQRAAYETCQTYLIDRPIPKSTRRLPTKIWREVKRLVS